MDSNRPSDYMRGTCGINGSVNDSSSLGQGEGLPCKPNWAQGQVKEMETSLVGLTSTRPN